MRPRTALFDDKAIQAVIDDALLVLRDVGVFVENDDAIALLREAGQTVKGQRAYLSEEVVRSAAESAPEQITLRGRNDQRLTLGGDAIHFDPGSSALYFLDGQSGARRVPTMMDCAHLGWITEHCKYVEIQATAIVPADVPREIADRLRLYAALCNSSKPVITGTFLKDGFAVMREMLEAVRGGAQALADDPLAIFDCCPTPPLKWSDLTCQALIDCARSKIPAELISMPMAGATSPVTIRDVVVQHAAENLSGVVIHQLAGRGAPIIYGGSPSSLDMRNGTTPMGAIETMMIDVAYAQVGKSLGLPTHAYMALSDAKCVDWQAGMETALGAVLAGLGGINVISGPGMMDFENCQSLEKLLLDNEICGMMLRLMRGIGEGSGDAPKLLSEVVAAGHFLGHPHTRENFRKEIHIPSKLIERSTYEDWQRRGEKSAVGVARAQVQKLLEKGNPAPLDAALQKTLGEMIVSDAKRLGLDGFSLS